MPTATITLYSDSGPLALTSERLLQLGGEGAVYENGAEAVKIYHAPDPKRAAKLRYLLLKPVARCFPANVLAPRTLIRDAAGTVVGFAMPRLPRAAIPARKLAQSTFCKQHDVGIAAAARLLCAVWDTLDMLHRRGIVVGDLNEGNIWFDRPALTTAAGSRLAYWIDVDSYQVGGFPCPVALFPFLDPNLYHVRDFKSRQFFSPETDWYAFTVLLVRLLLHVHPFGGTHHQLKSLAARAQAGVSIFDSSVTYPQGARPPQVLPDALLSYLRSVFAAGERGVFPRSLLLTLAHNVRHCPVCGLAYSTSRARCPHCQPRAAPVIRRTDTPWSVTNLLDGEATLSCVAPQRATRVAVVRYDQGEYELVHIDPGQAPRAIPLFFGDPGYRFALWGDFVVVNPPGARKLLLVDVSSGRARRSKMLEAALFAGNAAFAVAGRSLYRLVRGSMLRAELRHGHIVEDVTATVHRGQATLWGAPLYAAVAGYQRSLAGSDFFIGGKTGTPLSFPALPAPAGQSHGAMTACFSDKAVAFIWQSLSGGQPLTHYQTVTPDGKTVASMTFPATASPHEWVEGKALVGTTLLHPMDGGILKMDAAGNTTLLTTPNLVSATSSLYPWRDGLLIQNGCSLSYLTASSG